MSNPFKEEAFVNRCRAMAAGSIGKEMRVRTSKSSSFKGTIVRAEYAGTACARPLPALPGKAAEGGMKMR